MMACSLAQCPEKRVQITSWKVYISSLATSTYSGACQKQTTSSLSFAQSVASDAKKICEKTMAAHDFARSFYSRDFISHHARRGTNERRRTTHSLVRGVLLRCPEGGPYERVHLLYINRPFPSSLMPLFQSESKCKTILMKMTLICMKMKLHAELIFI